MQVLLVLSCLLAAAVAKPGFLGGAAHGLFGAGFAGPAAGYAAPAAAYAGYAGPAAYARYAGPAANIVIGPGGVPLDTPEVAAARKAHLAAVADTRARDAAINGAYGAGYAGAAGFAGAAGYVGVAPAAAVGYAGPAAFGPAAGLGYAGAPGLAAPSILALKAGFHHHG